MYNSLVIKSLFFSLLILLLKPPLNEISDLFFIVIGLFIVLYFDVKKYKKNYELFFLIIIIIILNTTANNKNINEAHSTFFSKKDINLISDFLPKKIIDDIIKSYKNLDISRVLKSHDGNKFSSEEVFQNSKFIMKSKAFSSDNLFYKSKFTRNVNSINFSSREELRIGQINTISYNLVFDRKLRRELPYYVLYEIPNLYKNSKICGKGNIYYAYDSNSLLENNIKNLEYQKLLSGECITLSKNYQNFYLIGYSINQNDNLEIKLKKNIKYTALYLFNILSIVFFIFIFSKIFFFQKDLFEKKHIVFFMSLISTLIFIFLKDPNILMGLRYFRGGADGLFHEFQAYEIIRNLYNNNLVESLRGGANIFYFMPGLRYFIAFNKIIFGETSYGHLIVGLLLPVYLYKLISNIVSEKIAFYSIISFLFIPIFENMGFGHFNYIGQIIRNHAETLSITIIIFCLANIANKDFILKTNFLSIFTYSFLLALAAFCRPNFFPTTILIILYLIIFIYKERFYLIYAIILGYSFILFSILHNAYFGDKIILFTQSNVHFVFNQAFQNLNINNYEQNFILHQITKWNPLYNFHRILILLFISYYLIKFKNTLFIYLLFTCLTVQHAVLLLTHPDSRYAYLAWLLTFLLFIYFLFNFLLKKLK